MLDDRWARPLHALAIAGILFSLLLYLPPPGPGALFFYTNPIPVRWVGDKASFIFTSLLIILGLWALAILVFKYSEILVGEDLYPFIRKILDKTGVSSFDKVGFILSLITLIVLPFFSFHYLPLGFSLVAAFFALMKAPVSSHEMAKPPSVESGGVEGKRLERRTYAWDFDFELGEDAPVKKPQFLELNLDLDAYEMAKGRNPSRERMPGPGDLVEFVGNGVTFEVKKVAEHIRETTRGEDLCSFLEVLNTIAFIQGSSSIPYKSDLETTGIAEYWRYPLETLVDQCGDCECKSILGAATFKVLGTGVLFLIYPPREGQVGHMAIAIEGGDSFPSGLQFFLYKGKKYFYCEPTAEGMHPGEIPISVRGVGPEVYVIP